MSNSKYTWSHAKLYTIAGVILILAGILTMVSSGSLGGILFIIAGAMFLVIGLRGKSTGGKV